MTAPTRIFLDTEFTGLVDDAKLISIGLIDAIGERSFYAELSDTWESRDASDFVRGIVLPQLDGGSTRITIAELGERLVAWLEAFNEPLQLATDSLAWDWRWLQEIFRAHGRWPTNVDSGPLLLTMNYLNNFDAFEAGIEAAFAGGLRRHHALDDAKANRLGWIAAGGDIDHTLTSKLDHGGSEGTP